MRVTNSEFQTFKRCKRQWYIAYHRHLAPERPEVVGPRKVGWHVHEALRAYYEVPELADEDRAIRALQVLDEVVSRSQVLCVTEEELKKFNGEADLARAMVEGYLDWLEETGADADLEIVAAETEITVPSGVEGIDIMGKLDVRVRRRSSGSRFLFDHKTVGTLQTPTLHIDEQPTHYILLEVLEGLAEAGAGATLADIPYSEGAIWNMLRKVKRTAAATPPFYGRVEVRRNVHELRSYWSRVHALIREIVETHRRLDAGEDPNVVCYPSPRATCSWDCDYLAVCPMFDDGSRLEDALSNVLVPFDPHQRYQHVNTDDTED